jgi:hypothetical protein
MGMVHNWTRTRYRRRSSRVYLTVGGAMRRLNTPLAQCLACDNVTSHGEFCYRHWSELVAKTHGPGYMVLTLPAHPAQVGKEVRSA